MQKVYWVAQDLLRKIIPEHQITLFAQTHILLHFFEESHERPDYKPATDDEGYKNYYVPKPSIFWLP